MKKEGIITSPGRKTYTVALLVMIMLLLGQGVIVSGQTLPSEDDSLDGLVAGTEKNDSNEDSSSTLSAAIITLFIYP